MQWMDSMDVSRITHFTELPDVLTTKEAASYLGLHVKTLRAYIRDGKLRAARCGRHYRIRRQWLAAFLDKESR